MLAQLANSQTSTVYFVSGRARKNPSAACFSLSPMTCPLYIGFKMILNGECDSIPESCFLFAGTIDDVLAKAKQQ